MKIIELVDIKLSQLETPLNLIGGVCIIFLALLGTLQVISRTLFDAPILGYIDVVEQGTALFAFLGLAYTQRLGGHVRMELVLQKLSLKRQYQLEFFNTTLALLIVALLLPGSYLHFERALLIGDSTQSIGLPTWPTKGVVFFSICLLALRLSVQGFGFARLWMHPDAEPIGVPTVKHLTDVAKEEVRAQHDS